MWLACLELAATSSASAQAVSETWSRERRAWQAQLLGKAAHAEAGDDVMADAEVLQGLVLGLSIRRLLDGGFSHDRSAALLTRTISALGTARTAP